MKRQLVISAEAQRDLLRMRDYIADDNPNRAVPYGFYMIFYTVTERRARIRAVKHSATLK
ncbi:hypothetical protein [Caulobacter sp.]|uniref:hypothetical protein n=1 Tax=Caulobacter sp. TaxID=78 RepID=UPI002B4899B9|nr:hypothetical protein [Caulobacter sp.]HJV41874.1 hypothetical protein [Caulobacter sp.]